MIKSTIHTMAPTVHQHVQWSLQYRFGSHAIS